MYINTATMTNLEIIRDQFDLVRNNWALINRVQHLPTVILAARDQTLSVNISIRSQDLDEFWLKQNTSQVIPDNFRALADRCQTMIIDVTALHSHGSTIRAYAYARDFYSIPRIQELWPVPAVADINLVGLGIYSTSDLFKCYTNSLEGVIKETHSVDGAVTVDHEFAVELPTEQDLEPFGLSGLGIDLEQINIMRRQDLSADYLTVWDH